MILAPANDFFATAYFEDINPTTFEAVPVTSATITAFIATSNDPAAIAADPSLSVSAVHVGVTTPTPTQYPLGTWGVTIDATVLTVTLLDNLFGTPSVTPYLIVVRAGGVRAYQKLKYLRSVPADTA